MEIVKPVLKIFQSFRMLASILSVLSYAVAFLVRFFLPELMEAVYYLLTIGTVLMLYALAFSLKQIGVFVVGRQGRYGINSALMILIFVGIVFFASYLGRLGHKRFDMTASGRFTLAPQTIKTLEHLKAPVEVLAFFPDLALFQADREQVGYLLEAYHSKNPDFSYRFIDPETRPALARKYHVRQNGTIVFNSGDRQKRITRVSEKDFTGALLEVQGIKSKKICFLSGHGEKNLKEQGGNGYHLVRKGLIRDLYGVGTLNLTQHRAVPSDCAVLVIAGASKALPPGERDAIRLYLKNHGKLLLLTDPGPPIEIQQILSDWGILINEGRVVDGKAYAVPDKRSPAVYRGSYAPMIITRDLDTTYFPDATTIDLTRQLRRVLKADRGGKADQPGWPVTAVQRDNLVVLPALLTTKDSWMEKSVGGSTKTPLEAEDRKEGPLVIGAMLMASSNLIGDQADRLEKEKLTRIIVIGDSDFATNRHIRNGGNSDLLLNSISWLSEETQLINIRPKQYTFRRLVISRNALHFIQFSSLGLLPLIVLTIGGVIWWKNR